jgi:phosphoglucomutase
LRDKLATLPGQILASRKVGAADDFAYHDPVDGSDARGQGVRVMFEDGARIVYRLSGTGTVGATIRIYVEAYEPASGDLGQDAQKALQPLIALARDLSEIEKRTSRKAPSVIT